jgi:hypothetical protein
MLTSVSIAEILTIYRYTPNVKPAPVGVPFEFEAEAESHFQIRTAEFLPAKVKRMWRRGAIRKESDVGARN